MPETRTITVLAPHLSSCLCQDTQSAHKIYRVPTGFKLLKYHSCSGLFVRILDHSRSTSFSDLWKSCKITDIPPSFVCVSVCVQSCLTLCNPVDVASQAPLSMEFPRREYWSGLPCRPPGGLPDPGVEPAFPTQEWNPRLLHWQTGSLPLRHLGSPLLPLVTAAFYIVLCSIVVKLRVGHSDFNSVCEIGVFCFVK